MASPSKENILLNLILENSPLTHWHFEDFVKSSGMSRSAVNKWLSRYMDEGLLKRIKEKGKFPYFTCGSNNPAYLERKRLHMLSRIYGSGLISHLSSLKDAKTVIIFGSVARGDWYKDSDIDIFIFGSKEGFEKHKYEMRLKRDIELHVFRSKYELGKVKSGLIGNVVNGYLVKGSIQDFAKVTA